VAGCCEHGNELPFCVKGLSLFELLSEYRSIEKGISLLACYQSVTHSFAPEVRYHTLCQELLAVTFSELPVNNTV
jgi:hypothetical protein